MARNSWHRNGTSPPVLAKRIALGMGGALAGTMAAVYPIMAGLAFIHPFAMVAGFCVLGGIAGFLDSDSQAAGPAARPDSATTVVAAGVKRVDSVQMLSGFGMLFANSAALLAAWLVVVEAPPKISWAIAIGFWWLFGITAQTGAGVLARFRAVDPEVV